MHEGPYVNVFNACTYEPHLFPWNKNKQTKEMKGFIKITPRRRASENNSFITQSKFRKENAVLCCRPTPLLKSYNCTLQSAVMADNGTRKQ